MFLRAGTASPILEATQRGHRRTQQTPVALPLRCQHRHVHTTTSHTATSTHTVSEPCRLTTHERQHKQRSSAAGPKLEVKYVSWKEFKNRSSPATTSATTATISGTTAAATSTSDITAATATSTSTTAAATSTSDITAATATSTTTAATATSTSAPAGSALSILREARLRSPRSVVPIKRTSPATTSTAATTPTTSTAATTPTTSAAATAPTTSAITTSTATCTTSTAATSTSTAATTTSTSAAAGSALSILREARLRSPRSVVPIKRTSAATTSTSTPTPSTATAATASTSAAATRNAPTSTGSTAFSAVSILKQARRHAPRAVPINRSSHQILHAVSFGVAESAATRPYMEDRHQVLPALPPIHAGLKMASTAPHLPLDASYAAVFDGHSGSETAEHAAARLHVHLTAEPSLRSFLGGGHEMVSAEAHERVVGRALRHAFRETDEEILSTSRQAPGDHSSGSTALVVLRLGSHLYTANAGDCRAVLCRNGRPVRLTQAHQPELPSERQRVEREGGLLHFQNGWRVVVEERDGLPKRGVRVTRGLGDLHFKEPLRLVESEPDVRRTQLEPADAFVVLATDGVWNSVPDDMATAVLQAALKEQASAGASATDAANVAAKRLLWRALDRGCQDNATVVVMVLDWDSARRS